MKRQIRRTQTASADIVEIYVCIHEHSPQGAELTIDAIERSILALADTPGVGWLWPTPKPWLKGMRITTVTPYRNYLIFFRLINDVVEIFRVVHGARDLQRVVDQIHLDFED